MDRGTCQAEVQGVAKIRHDLVTKQQQQILGRIHWVLYNFVWKIEAEVILPNLLCGESIILITKARQRHCKEGNYR